MADIFISYASDDRPRAEPIAKALEAQGWSVFWDRTMLPGTRFEHEIQAQIDQAKCVVVLWSQQSILSDWVKDEASEGNKKEILVPAIIDAVAPPLGFRSIQAADLTDWKKQTGHAGFSALKKAIFEKAGAPPGRDASSFARFTDQSEATRPAPAQHKSVDGSNIAGLQPGHLVSLAFMTAITFLFFAIVLFRPDFLGLNWAGDDFLVYYIACVSTVTLLYGTLLKFTGSEEQVSATKMTFLLVGFLATFAVALRGIFVFTYSGPKDGAPMGLCVPSAGYLPYIAIFAIAVSAMVCIIFVCTRDQSKLANRIPIFNYFIKFCMYLAVCRLAWEIIDRIGYNAVCNQ